MSLAWPDVAEGAAPVDGGGFVPQDVALVPKRAYFSDDVLREEVSRLFAGSWLFVGTTAELAENHSFVTLDLPGVAVVVQNFKGELRAFQNACTHRFNRIQTQERGSRPLQCGYHAWTFDQSGFPAGRPKRDQFPSETPASRERLCLPRYRVETWGCFVFVDVSGAAPPLGDFLGEVGDPLKTLGAAIGHEIQYTSYPHACNWKLLVENVLECYHCAAVHPETFIEGLGVGRQQIRDIVVDGGHSSCHFPRTEIKREKLRRKVLSHLSEREYAHDSFFHIFVSPNLFVSSTEGVTFYIGQALPVDARHAVLRTRIYEPRASLSAGGRARQDLLNAQSVTMVERVIAEDRAILEAVQRGVEVSSKPGILGADEVRIAAFFAHYRQRMGDALPAD
jgi:phenylpropionate dioxygenase-like ring-hydroxylating dioxygenase large terminal subunit